MLGIIYKSADTCVCVPPSSTSSHIFFQYDSFLKDASYSNITSQKEYEIYVGFEKSTVPMP